MKTNTKRSICLTVSWLAFMLMLSIVFGCEKGWSELKAMWWCIPCLVVWAVGLWKAGWIRV